MNDVLVCVRTANLKNAPIEGSERSVCTRCASEVWVSPSGVAILKTRALDIICVACMVNQVNADGGVPDVAKATPEQVEEIIVQLIKDRH